MLKYNVISGKNPKTGAMMYYARLIPTTPIKLSFLADVISKQSTVTIHDVKAVLSALEEHIISYLLSGNSVRLGDLGSFRLTLNSKAAETAEEFTGNNISGVRVRFTASSNMRYLLDKSNPNVQFLKVDEVAEGENGETNEGETVE